MEDLESKRANLVSEVVSPITDIVNTKFGSHGSPIEKLDMGVVAQEVKVECCLCLILNACDKGLSYRLASEGQCLRLDSTKSAQEEIVDKPWCRRTCS